MMSTFRISIATTYVWIGCVLSISFMEAWLKFRAPGITVPLGLGIGKLVFHALNYLELSFSGILLFDLVRNNYFKIKGISFRWSALIPISIVLCQTFYLLPALDLRADAQIAGLSVSPSFLHIYYVILEVTKMFALLWLGSKLLTLQQIVLKHV